MPPASRTGRELARNFALLLATSALCVAVAVGFLVLDEHLSPTVYQLDDRCLYRLVPGSVKQFQHLRVNGGARVTVRINRSGFRGDELADPRLVERIVVYGDSFIEAETSPLEETFCKQLEHELQGHLPGERV